MAALLFCTIWHVCSQFTHLPALVAFFMNETAKVFMAHVSSQDKKVQWFPISATYDYQHGAFRSVFLSDCCHPM